MKQRFVLTMVLTCLVVAASLTSAGAQWLFLGIDDCSGDDTACSAGATPDPSLCNETTNGTTAVCWDGVTHSNGIGCGSSAWCTYKAVSAPSCTGGSNPGFVYECIGPLPTITATGTQTATPTQTPTRTSTATPTSTPTPTLAAGCPATPATCLAAGKNGLLIKTDSDSSKNQFSWKWKKGTAPSAQTDFGDPVNGTAAYTLCLYDSTGGIPALVMGLNVAPGGTCGTDPCWKAISDKGWSYKNPTGSSEGVTKVKFKGGTAGKPSLQLRGKGAALPLPAPISPTQSLAEDPSVVVQFHSGSPATCWSSTFTATGTKKNDGAHFKATDP